MLCSTRIYAVHKPFSRDSTKQTGLSVSEPFVRWASLTGILSPKIAQSQFGDLRGYRAIEDIKAGESIVSLPRRAALTLWPLQPPPADCLISHRFWEGAPWFIQMSLLLLLEKRKGSASPVWGYIQQLPESVDLPLQWADQELQELQYTPIIQEVEVQRGQWQALYQDVVAAQRGASGVSSGGEGGAGVRVVSWEEFLWAMENVCSRAFAEGYTGPPLGQRLALLAALVAGAGALASWQQLPVEAAMAGGVLAAPLLNWVFDVGVRLLGLRLHMMCPVIDGANHRSNVQSEVRYDYLSDSVTLRALCAFSQGQQVFISYGPHCNDSLLMYYGFLEEGGNPRDTYQLEVLLDAPGQTPIQVFLDSEGQPSRGSLARLREALRGTEGGAVTVTAEADMGPVLGGQQWDLPGGIPPRTQQAAHKPRGQAQEEPGSGTPVSGGSRVEAEVWEVLAVACQKELQGKPTTLQRDLQLLAGQSNCALPTRTRLAVQYRVLKKQLLQRCIKHSQEVLQALAWDGKGLNTRASA